MEASADLDTTRAVSCNYACSLASRTFTSRLQLLTFQLLSVSSVSRRVSSSPGCPSADEVGAIVPRLTAKADSCSFACKCPLLLFVKH